MSQHDYDISNQSGLAFRTDLNNCLAAIVSQNSGTTEPTTTFAYQLWADTTNDLLKIRDAANTGWITLLTLSTGVLPSDNLPDFAGDVTSSAGVTTVEKIAGVAVGTPTGIGNVVMSASPTLSGTVEGAASTWSGTNQAPVFQSATSTPATAGIVRLADADSIDWRNHANGANISLAKDTSDNLTYNGNKLMDSSGKLNIPGAVPANSLTRTQLNADTNNGLAAAWANFYGIPLTGTYGRSGTLVTIAMTAHGMTSGQVAHLTFSAGTGGTATTGSYVITNTGANSFTITDTASGTITASPSVTRDTWTKSSYNVAGITRSSTGIYILTWANAFSDAFYTPILSAGGQNNSSGTRFWGSISTSNADANPPTTTTMGISVGFADTSPADCSRISVVIFGS